MLSLARIPLPHIGPFRFQDDCTIGLTNRPLTCSTVILENEGCSSVMQRDGTYQCTDSFVADSLTLRDNALRSNPNAVYGDEDCRGQMAFATLLRALSNHFICCERRNGPFLLQFADLHASNIIVDEDWNMRYILDLEWVCALPAEMLTVPHWLTGNGIDEIREERLDEFNKVREEFMSIFEAEERKTVLGHGLSLADITRGTWGSKGTWFRHCVEYVNALLYFVADHICPVFDTSLTPKTEDKLSRFWFEDSEGFVEEKVGDQKRYAQELRDLLGKR